VRVGIAIDEALNVLFFDGQPDETISLHAADAQRAGRRWGCVLCKILSVIVERDHCAKQFLPGTTAPTAALRAGIALAVLASPLFIIYKLIAAVL
jgi:hypothetical protein